MMKRSLLRGAASSNLKVVMMVLVSGGTREPRVSWRGQAWVTKIS